jgi:protein TonB
MSRQSSLSRSSRRRRALRTGVLWLALTIALPASAQAPPPTAPPAAGTGAPSAPANPVPDASPPSGPGAAQGTQAPPAPGSLSSTKVSPEVVRKWQMTINNHLNQFKRYPPQAREHAEKGTVKVAFVLDSGGHIVSSHIVTSSGSAILDQETLDLLKRAEPYPLPPAGTSGQDLFLQIPISYALR